MKLEQIRTVPPPLRVSSISIRLFNLNRDTGWAYQLWQASFNPKWDVQRNEFSRRLAESTFILVAEQGQTPVGLCAVAYRETDTAGLLLLMVNPSSRGQGRGRELLHHAEEMLREKGVRQLNLGNGSAGGYFWPGVPQDQLKAWAFFEGNGWRERERSFDLYRDLGRFQMPSWALAPLAETGVILSLCRSEDAQHVIQFERTYFPLWAQFFEDALRDSKFQNVLIARTKGDRVVGTLLLEAEETPLWNKNLGERCGSLSVLGVAPDQQKKGIGIALAARAMEVIQERGGTGCYIHWTGLVDWYGKLGAKIWAEYIMSSKQLAF